MMSLIFLGAGGHAKVLLDMARQLGLSVVGVCDPDPAVRQLPLWRGVRVLGGDDVVETYATESVLLVNGVGSLPGQAVRRIVFERFKAKGYRFATLVHPAAIVGEGVSIAEGAQIMAGVVLQADATVGENVIVNTRASVDHDCCIEAHVHVAPGAILCGSVRVEQGAHIGCGATIIQGISVGRNAVIGASAIVARDVSAGQKVIGRCRASGPSVKGSEL